MRMGMNEMNMGNMQMGMGMNEMNMGMGMNMGGFGNGFYWMIIRFDSFIYLIVFQMIWFRLCIDNFNLE